MKIQQHIFFLFFFLLSMVTLTAQNPVVVQINVDSIQIGDPVSMEFIVNIKGGVSIEKISFANFDSIESLVKYPTQDGDEEVFYADFEFQNYGKWKKPVEDELIFEKPDLGWDDSQVENNLLRNTLAFTIWNEGVYLLPPVQITFNRGGRTYTQKANQIPLIVGSPLLTQAAQQDSVALSDIKPIIEEPLKFEDYIIYIIAAIFLIHLICLIYFLINNKQKVELLPIPVQQIQSHYLTENKLNQLNNAQLWQKGEVKEYLSHLTFIVREYLENRFNIPALESTSGQIIRQLKSVSLSENLQNQLRELFQKSDLVKFAKAEPESDFLDKSLTEALSLVKNTQKKENLIWVELKKLKVLDRKTEVPMDILGQTFRVTENLEELTNPKKLIYAAFWERFIARILDLLFFAVIFAIIFATIAFIKGSPLFETFLNFGWADIGLLFGLSWIYFALAEFKKGATFGKLLLGIQVRDLEGEKISLFKSTARWLGKIISEIFFFLANFWFYFDKERIQTLYDRVSKTIVIKK